MTTLAQHSTGRQRPPYGIMEKTYNSPLFASRKDKLHLSQRINPFTIVANVAAHPDPEWRVELPTGPTRWRALLPAPARMATYDTYLADSPSRRSEDYDSAKALFNDAARSGSYLYPIKVGHHPRTGAAAQ